MPEAKAHILLDRSHLEFLQKNAAGVNDHEEKTEEETYILYLNVLISLCVIFISYTKKNTTTLT